MEKKKSERADLQNKKVLFMEIGCIIALALVYFGFEYTSEEVRTAVLDDNSVITEIEDLIPITFETPPPPPAAPKIPVLSDQIDIVDDEIEIDDNMFLKLEDDPGSGVEIMDYIEDYEAVLEVALKTGYITEPQVAVLNAWRKDPAQWKG